MINQNENDWYVDWFDSPYYDLLYRNRNEEEAKLFMQKLVDFLQPPPKTKILDIPCGKGRHSIFLNSLGFAVHGMDLSYKNIHAANSFTNESLQFSKHDIRNNISFNQFDWVINLFTSLGYFEDENDNRKAISNLLGSLKKGGYLVIDFFNEFKVRKDLPQFSSDETGGIKFNIRKKAEGKFALKEIEVTDGEIKYHFTEKVQLLSLSDFMRFVKPEEAELRYCFGNYLLCPFEPKRSERLIMIWQKK